MADYYTPTVIQPMIPEADMTPLERLLLTRIFSFETDGNSLYFYAEEGPSDLAVIDRGELEEALAACREAGDSRATSYVADHLARRPADEAEVEIDLSGSISWEAFLQDIVRRSPRLRYVTVISSFTCSRRSDGFGGMAVLITAERILAKSTGELIEEFLKETGLEA